MPDAGSRLVALVRAGPYRFALSADALLEVTQSAPDSEVPSLMAALGETASQGGQWSVSLRGIVVQSYRVDVVEGVRELSPAHFYQLPQGVGLEPEGLVRGVFAVEGELALELRAELLEGLPPRPTPDPPPLKTLAEPASKALVFSAAGRSMAFPLHQVLSVLSRPQICPVPRAGFGVPGVVEHGHTLYPVVDLGARHFGAASTGELGVAVEQDGRPWLVLADAVRGVRGGFQPKADLEAGWMQDERGERALFICLEGS